MIARIGTVLVRFKTLPPPRPAPEGDPHRLIEESRRKYCRPAQEIRNWRRRHHDPPSETSGSRLPGPKGCRRATEEMTYHEY